MRLYTLSCLLILTSFTQCKRADRVPAERYLSDSARVMHFIGTGDRLYAARDDYHSFENALLYYDSAQQTAQHLKNNFLEGQVVFSKASVYNAWNKAPQKTTELFRQAADIFGREKKFIHQQYYCLYLVAHSYDGEKANDSTSCIVLLEKIYDSITILPDTVRRKMAFIPDLAWVATNCRNYDLAEKILNKLTTRPLIVNDPKTNNYLDHYYITKARIDLYKNKNYSSPFLDSLAFVCNNLEHDFEKLYYSETLAKLYADAGNYAAAYRYGNFFTALRIKIQDSAGINSLQNKLLTLELENEKRKQEAVEQDKRNRNRLLVIMAFALAAISYLTYRLSRERTRYKNTSEELLVSNGQLDAKMNEVTLLNKEMQHRVKNNLQTIFSLLQMQERKTANVETIEHLQHARLRIGSIAKLHDHLLNAEKAPVANMESFITSMIDSVVDCFANGKQVTTHLNIHDLALLKEQHISMALILNEWVTNSLKYAAPPANNLSLHFSFTLINDRFEAAYYDNGIINNERLATGNGIGNDIVKLLCAQMKGSLTIAKNNPYFYTLTLPHAK